MLNAVQHRGIENVVTAGNIDFKTAQAVILCALDPQHRRQVDNHRTAPHCAHDAGPIENRPLGDREVPGSGDGIEAVPRRSNLFTQIEAGDTIPLADQLLGKPSANQSCDTGDENSFQNETPSGRRYQDNNAGRAVFRVAKTRWKRETLFNRVKVFRHENRIVHVAVLRRVPGCTGQRCRGGLSKPVIQKFLKQRQTDRAAFLRMKLKADYIITRNRDDRIFAIERNGR